MTGTITVLAGTPEGLFITGELRNRGLPIGNTALIVIAPVECQPEPSSGKHRLSSIHGYHPCHEGVDTAPVGEDPRPIKSETELLVRCQDRAVPIPITPVRYSRGNGVRQEVPVDPGNRGA